MSGVTLEETAGDLAVAAAICSRHVLYHLILISSGYNFIYMPNIMFVLNFFSLPFNKHYVGVVTKLSWLLTESVIFCYQTWICFAFLFFLFFHLFLWLSLTMLNLLLPLLQIDEHELCFFSFLEFPIPSGIAFIGEVGLGGELRMVHIFSLFLNCFLRSELVFVPLNWFTYWFWKLVHCYRESDGK